MANLERDNEAVKKELAAANARVEELEQCFKSLLAERNDKEHGELQNVASKQMKQALETLCQAMGLKIAGHMDNM
jgi:predicted RNase H-like nuclease (RuvC/YqgF family)